MSTDLAHTRRLTLPLILCASLLLGAAPAHATRPTSPSAALKKADTRVGTRSARFARKPTDRVDFGEDRTGSPYLFVAGGDPRSDRLPLKETSADVQIAGVIAQVKVTQVFENDGKKAIEAVYVFPGSTRSAVHGMTMTIGKRTVVAKIEKKADARAQYEQAKREGKRASLLEENRPNVFTMNIANLMPGDRIVVELDYSELLVPEDGTYTFVYPTVVGPRFTGETQGDTGFAANPHLPAGQAEPYRFDIDVHLDAGLPIQSIDSPSHELTITRPSNLAAEVGLAKSGGAGTRDFVLRYRLAGGEIETGLLLYEHTDGQKYFLLMLEPPTRPKPKAIPPREYVFLLDVSGSMRGYPLDTSKALMKRLLGQLRVSDAFNIAFFSGGSWMMSTEASLPATDANIAAAMQLVDSQRGGGGTRLMDGLRTAYKLPRGDKRLSRSVIVVTDGYVSVESQTFKFIRERLNEANLFAFGIGSSVNRALIEGMARAGQGEPFIVFGPKKAGAVAERLGEMIREPVLSQITYRFEGFGAREVAPMKLPDLLARRPLVLFGKYKGSATGTIVVRGQTGQGPFVKRIDVSKFQPESSSAPIRVLWARKWVAFLSDALAMTGGAGELVDAITDLGLAYDLLTEHTSFVAIDSEVVNAGGEGQTVRQALPMPEGVSNQAVAAALAQPRRRAPGRAQPPMAPPPALAPMPTGRAVKRELKQRTRGGSSSGSLSGGVMEDAEPSQGAGVPRFLVTKAKVSGIPEAKALVAAIEKKLAKLAAVCGVRGAKVELELTLSASGKVTAVKVRGGSKALGACLAAKLRGLQTGQKLGKGGKLILGLMVIRV